ncbi:TonB family protein [Lutibacter sp.]|uniref:energy transducer TonB n=1 Tax=Lutibacter sp. TaxID=1925666 RepID=UPI0025BA764E|nr:TonB family protein [Lutibacter sp.]MCF6167482.1 energy transducer TonB [Lutibacter sp.]
MKIISATIFLFFLVVQTNAQNTLASIEDNVEFRTSEFNSLTTKINSQPQFPGGNKELAKYLSKNIRYPKNSENSSSRGKVIVCFKIEKNGKISTIEIVKGINKILNKEAKRVIANMPNWKPALRDSNPIASEVTIPIVFLRY